MPKFFYKQFWIDLIEFDQGANNRRESDFRQGAICGVVAGIIILLATLAAKAQAPYAYDVPTGSPEAFRPYQAVCELTVTTSRGRHWGSGTLIAVRGNTALVLSCRHVCVRAGQELQVRWPLAGNQTSRGVVWEVIPGRGFDTDLALLICSRPVGVSPVAVSSLRASIPGKFVAAGWRDGQLRVAVSDRASVNADGTIIVPVPFIGGQSGGCLFNGRGRLIGVVVASDRVTMGLSADGPLLHSLVNKYRRKPYKERNQ